MDGENIRPETTDEIDFFGLLQTIWESKYVIIGFTILGLIVGSAMLLTQKPKYLYSASYLLNYQDFQFTESTRNTPFVSPSSYFTGSGFSLNQRNAKISRTHDGSKSIEAISKELEDENLSISKRLSESAQLDLDVLNGLSSEYRSTEVIAASAYYKAKIVNDFSNGVMAFTISRPSQKKINDNVLILAVAGILGCFLGLFFVLIRKSYHSYQRRRETNALGLH